jgi:hypothetical protein
MRKSKTKMVRTTITIPASLKEKMSQINANWSEVVREVISQKLQEESQPDMAEAVILNERVRRPAPEGWSSLAAIKEWRRKKSS